MPAGTLFADTEVPAPNMAMDDHRTLQLALDLQSMLSLGSSDQSLGICNETDNHYLSALEMERANKRSQNMTECVAVPSSEHVAEIVGRQGCKIKALRAKTNTYIKTPVRGEEPVFVVTGRKEDVALAKREILSAAEHFSQIRACRKNNLNGSMAPGPPTNVPGQITIQVRVPYRVVGLVVGPKGATIKRIQQVTHTYIVTPSRDKEPVFEVTGMPDMVDQARKEIEAHIATRTGNLLDDVDPTGTLLGSRGGDMQCLENLFGSSSNGNHELVSSLYKLSQGGMSMSSSMGGCFSTGMNGHHNGFGNGFNNGMHSLTSNLNGMNDSSFTLLGDAGSSLLNGSAKHNNSLDMSLFSSFGGMGNKMSDGGQGGGMTLYGMDEGLGSLGSSIGSSPSFDPVPTSIWSDLGSLGGNSGLDSGVSSVSSLSSTFSLTRRSSSVSGASPPSSRLSPSPLDSMHPPARRISSDPMPSLAMMTAFSLGGLTNGCVNAPKMNSLPPSPASSPELVNGEGRSISPNKKTPVDFDKKFCVSCSGAEVVAALVPCGHNSFCLDCASHLVEEGNNCPLCGTKASQAIRIIFS